MEISSTIFLILTCYSAKLPTLTLKQGRNSAGVTSIVFFTKSPDIIFNNCLHWIWLTFLSYKCLSDHLEPFAFPSRGILNVCWATEVINFNWELFFSFFSCYFPFQTRSVQILGIIPGHSADLDCAKLPHCNM